MNKTIAALFCCFFILLKSSAQTSTWPGTWQMQYHSTGSIANIKIELQVAAPEKNVLYPALLKVQCDSFKAAYELLLVKKTIRELAISKNKYPLYENPFSVGGATCFINGIFDNSVGPKDIPTLTLERIQPGQNIIPTADTIHLTKTQKALYLQLRDILKKADIILNKVNSIPWQEKDAENILAPHLSPAYFGLLDTIYLQDRAGEMNLTSSKKSNNDIASVALNGVVSIDQLTLNKKTHTEDIFIDTGLNILAFFADNFENGIANKGKLNVTFGNKKFDLDFNSKSDSAATFIVAKLYYAIDKSKEKKFQDYIPPPGENKKPLQKNEKLLGSIVATDRQVTLAVWDDDVEDGDSISINIDGKWLVQGFRVKNAPQFISVILTAGPNTITFIADNLGSIPPNTSVLEIIDGNKRKSFSISTAPGENNLVKIFYDTKANL